MAKKKTSQQKRQKEPCEEDTSDEELKSYSSAKVCPHVAKGINLSRLKKALKNTINLEKCKDCTNKVAEKVCAAEQAAEEPNEVWLCLQCGYCGCGRNSTNKHAMLHYKTPHSDCHALVLSTISMSTWCYTCDESVPVETSRNLKECIEFISKNKDKKPQPVVVNGTAKHLQKNVMQTESPADVPIKPEKSTPAAKSKQNEAPGKNTSGTGKKSGLTNIRAVKGLSNLGNTCFFNSILQNMCQTPWLLQEMEQRSEKGYLWEIPFLVIDNEIVQNPENPSRLPLLECGPLTLSFCNFLKQMKKPPRDNRNEVFNPSHLFDQICRKSPQFRGNHQQDSHEFLRHLLDGIRNEEIKRQKRAVLRKFKLEKANPDEVDENTKNLMKAYGSFASHTVVERIFGGQLMSTVVCEECKVSSQVFEPFMDLSLPLAEEKVMRTMRGHNKQVNDDGDFGMSAIQKRLNGENTLSKHQERKIKQQAKKAAKRKAKFTSNLTKSNSRDVQQQEGVEEDLVLPEGANEGDPEDRERKNDHHMQNTSSIDGNDEDKEESNHEQSDADIEDNDDSETIFHNLYEPQTNSQVPKATESSLTDCRVVHSKDVATNCESNTTTLSNQSEGTSKENKPIKCNGDCTGKSNPEDRNIAAVPDEIAKCEANGLRCCGKDSVDTLCHFQCYPSQRSKPTEQSDADVEDNDESESVVHKKRCPVHDSGDLGAIESCNNQSAEDNSKAIDSGIEELCSQITDVRIRQESDRQEDFLGCMDDDDADHNNKGGRPRSSHNSVSEEAATDEWSHHWTKEWVRQSLTTLKARYQPSSLECSVNSCLNQFTASELLTGSNKFRCENCTSQRQKITGDEKVVVYSNASKQLLIFSPPPVLTLHLKRFQQTGASLRKLNLFVEFPEILDLAPYCSSICRKLPHMSGVKDEVLYSLYGVVQHSGKLSSGHYTAYIKIGDTQPVNPAFLNAWPTNHCNLEHFLEKVSKFTQNNNNNGSNSTTSGGSSSSGSQPSCSSNSSSTGHKWYYISDSFFKEVSASDVFQCQAYILFYQRIK